MSDAELDADTELIDYGQIVDGLLNATRASRTTVRLAGTDGLPWLVAEALAPGIESMWGLPTTVDIVCAETYQYLERERTELVQVDCRAGDPAPPAMLVNELGVRAQMLAPIVVMDQMVGAISVHYTGSPRRWSSEDLGALRAARDLVESRIHAQLSRYLHRHLASLTENAGGSAMRDSGQLSCIGLSPECLSTFGRSMGIEIPSRDFVPLSAAWTEYRRAMAELYRTITDTVSGLQSRKTQR